MLDRYELVDDQDETVMSLNRLVQLKEDRKYKMRNDSFFYDFAVSNSETLSPDLVRFCLKSKNVKISLSENPFQIFGKNFNVRMKANLTLGPFNSVISQTNLAKTVKNNLIAIFIEMFPKFKGMGFGGVGSSEAMSTLILKSISMPRRKSNASPHNDLLPKGQTQNITTIADIEDDALCLVFKPHIHAFATRLANVPIKSEIFDIRGPFGTGLGISRFSSGNIILAGQGSACLAFVDFIDFIARMYMYRYAKKMLEGQMNSSSSGSTLADLDPYKDDFEETFNNNLSLSFYLSFRNKADFEALYKRDFQIITALETELKLNIVKSVVVRLKKEDFIQENQYPALHFTQTRIEEKTMPELVQLLGFPEQGLGEKVEKVIAAGNKKFCDQLKEGMSKLGLEKGRIKCL